MARLSEWLSGYVGIRIASDPDRRILSVLIERKVPIWNLRSDGQGYRMNIGLRHVGIAVAAARRSKARLRFAAKTGLPFWLWRANRRKPFLAGATLFVLGLCTLSSFVWRVDISGTDQPEAVRAVLQKLHVHPGSLLYRLLDQDSLQLALLDELPQISWVGVRIRGTAVYVHVIPRIPPQDLKKLSPRDMVAALPGVVATVLADKGRTKVLPGQLVTPGTVLIAGTLDDGKTVAAAGRVDAFVWYHSEVELPEVTSVQVATGDAVRHYYLTFGRLAVPVWGFARPSWPHTLVQDFDIPLMIADRELPVGLRVEKVLQAKLMRRAWNEGILTERGRDLVARDVLRRASAGALILRQSVLQRKVEHGKLYMSIWTEVLEDIAVPRPLTGRAQE